MTCGCGDNNSVQSRRSAIGGVMGMGIAAASIPFVAGSQSQVEARTMLESPTPDEALAALMAGNERYIKGNMIPDDHASTRARLVDGQAPHAIILRCADSRVSPEIVFDQGLGEIFVCGVAGNIPTPDIVASMEFAVAVLGSPLIVVMGHSSCGAVDAAVKHIDSVESLPGSLPGLVSQILPAAIETKDSSGDRLKNAIAANVVNGMQRLPKMSEILNDGHEAGTLKIVGGVYDLKSGRFNLVEG